MGLVWFCAEKYGRRHERIFKVFNVFVVGVGMKDFIGKVCCATKEERVTRKCTCICV